MHAANLAQCCKTRSDGVGDLRPHGDVSIDVDTQIPYGTYNSLIRLIIDLLELDDVKFFLTMYHVRMPPESLRCFRKFSRSLLQRIHGSGNTQLNLILLTITEKVQIFFCMLLQ